MSTDTFDWFDSYIPSNYSSYFSKALKRLIGERYIDLFMHLPVRAEQFKLCQSLSDAEYNEHIIISLWVKEIQAPKRSYKTPYRIVLTDKTDDVEVIFFHIKPGMINKLYPLGEKITISGVFEYTKYAKGCVGRFSHPSHFRNDEIKSSGCFAVYPLTQGISQAVIRRFIQQHSQKMPTMPEWIPPAYLSDLSLPSFSTSLKMVHDPLMISKQKEGELSPAQMRLVFDEFLAHQLSLILSSRKMRQLTHQKNQTQREEVHPSGPEFYQTFIEDLPFSLTRAQEDVIQEILNDFKNPESMVRLLQGDVGAGKTVVAYCTALYHIARGGQVAFLAPTEILAQQHYEGFLKYLKRLDLHSKSVLLLGKTGTRERRTILNGLLSGDILFTFGTHAIIQEDVTFKNLTYCIIDEQHRFGVEQRLKLYHKGKRVDLLSMTATPIPRTLTLAQYGDMDISLLKEKPKGRQKIITKLQHKDKLPELIDVLKKRVEQGYQAFWVCPVIEESQTMTSAVERYESLCQRLGKERVGLVHGRMKSSEKDAIMSAFKNNELSVLVATTVIEVGVDVPHARIMIIEHSERFGLSQLHQLRGRVGRGQEESYCVLVYSFLSTAIRKRLEAMRDTDDGFVLSELDLQIRGSGELIGTQQSGMPKFQFSHFDTESKSLLQKYQFLMEKSNELAWHLALNENVYQHHALTYLLPIFNKDLMFAESG